MGGGAKMSGGRHTNGDSCDLGGGSRGRRIHGERFSYGKSHLPALVCYDGRISTDSSMLGRLEHRYVGCGHDENWTVGWTDVCFGS